MGLELVGWNKPEVKNLRARRDKKFKHIRGHVKSTKVPVPICLVPIHST